MKSFQKIPALVVVISILLGILTGCFEKELNGELDGLPQMEKLKPVTLTFLMYGQEHQDTKEVLNMIAEKSGLNIKLDFKWETIKYFTAVKKLLAEGDSSIDAFVCGKPTPKEINFVDMFRDGELKDITELVPKYAPDIFIQYLESELDAAKVDGRLVALPSLFPRSEMEVGVEVRNDLMEKYGLAPIRTFEDYGNYLRIIKENEPDIFPGVDNFFDSISYFANAYGYAIFDKASKLVYKWDDKDMRIIPWERTPEFRKITALINEWRQKAYLKVINTTDNELRRQEIYSAASNITGIRSNMEGVEDIEVAVKGETKKIPFYSYALYPEKKVQRTNPIDNINIGTAIAFNSKSANTERALMFLNWIQKNQENYDLMVYGIKDRHYKLKGESILLENNSFNNNLYMNFFCRPFENIAFSRYYTSGAGSDPKENSRRKMEYIDHLQSNTFYPPHTGFYPNYKEIQEKLDRRTELYNSLIEDDFYSKGFDPEQTENIISSLREAGTDEVVNEMQRQLYEWRQRKGEAK